MENQNVIQRGHFKCYMCPADNHSNGRVIAVSTCRYNGKTVRGVAICSLNDTFDVEKGCKLAIARCKHSLALADYQASLDEYAKTVKVDYEIRAKKCKLATRVQSCFENILKAAENCDNVLNEM